MRCPKPDRVKAICAGLREDHLSANTLRYAGLRGNALHYE